MVEFIYNWENDEFEGCIAIAKTDDLDAFTEAIFDKIKLENPKLYGFRTEPELVHNFLLEKNETEVSCRARFFWSKEKAETQPELLKWKDASGQKLSEL